MVYDEGCFFPVGGKGCIALSAGHEEEGALNVASGGAGIPSPSSISRVGSAAPSVGGADSGAGSRGPPEGCVVPPVSLPLFPASPGAANLVGGRVDQLMADFFGGANSMPLPNLTDVDESLDTLLDIR